MIDNDSQKNILEERKQYKIEEGEKKPIVFMFQPTHYLVVTPQKLNAWENYLIDNIGIRSTTDMRMSNCISFCPGLDDSDSL